MVISSFLTGSKSRPQASFSDYPRNGFIRLLLGSAGSTSGRKANIQAESRTTVSFLVSTNRYEHHPRPILKPDYYTEPINERLDASGTLQIRI